MQRIDSKIDVKSSDYQEQYEHNRQLMDTLAERQQAVREAGKRGTQRMIDRGKIPARERVELLLDPDTSLAATRTDVNHRYFRRIVLPAASAFIEGFAEAISESGRTTVTVSGETVVEQEVVFFASHF